MVSRLDKFFKHDVFSSNHLQKIVQRAANANNAVIYCDDDHIVIHCMGKAVTQSLVKEGIPDTTKMMRKKIYALKA